MFDDLREQKDGIAGPRLSQDPVMWAVVHRRGLDHMAVSTNQMSRFEKVWLATDGNLTALSDLSGARIGRVQEHEPPTVIVLDMDNLRSPSTVLLDGWILGLIEIRLCALAALL